jgi:hypothetical protein
MAVKSGARAGKAAVTLRRVFGKRGLAQSRRGRPEVALKDIYFDKNRIAKKSISYKALIAS